MASVENKLVCFASCADPDRSEHLPGESVHKRYARRVAENCVGKAWLLAICHDPAANTVADALSKLVNEVFVLCSAALAQHAVAVRHIKIMMFYMVSGWLGPRHCVSALIMVRRLSVLLIGFYNAHGLADEKRDAIQFLFQRRSPDAMGLLKAIKDICASGQLKCDLGVIEPRFSCAYCQKESLHTKHCALCWKGSVHEAQWARYCDKDCQAAHWPTHRLLHQACGVSGPHDGLHQASSHW